MLCAQHHCSASRLWYARHRKIILICKQGTATNTIIVKYFVCICSTISFPHCFGFSYAKIWLWFFRSIEHTHLSLSALQHEIEERRLRLLSDSAVECIRLMHLRKFHIGITAPRHHFRLKTSNWSTFRTIYFENTMAMQIQCDSWISVFPEMLKASKQRSVCAALTMNSIMVFSNRAQVW